VIDFDELELALLPLPLPLEPQAAASVTSPTLRTSAPARLLTVPRLFIGSLFRAGALASATRARTRPPGGDRLRSYSVNLEWIHS
jgi:hypothetical protein